MDGRTAYGHYCGAVGYTTYDDRPIPKWEDLGERQQAGYNAIASASNAAARECVEALGADSDCVNELETLKERVDRLWSSHNANIESLRKMLVGERTGMYKNVIEELQAQFSHLDATLNGYDAHSIGALDRLEELEAQNDSLRQAHNDHVAASSYGELEQAARAPATYSGKRVDDGPSGLPTVVASAKYARDIASRDERIAELETELKEAREVASTLVRRRVNEIESDTNAALDALQAVIDTCKQAKDGADTIKETT